MAVLLPSSAVPLFTEPPLPKIRDGQENYSFLPHDMLHRTVRAEAAALLGIEEPPPPKAKEESPRNE